MDIEPELSVDEAGDLQLYDEVGDGVYLLSLRDKGPLLEGLGQPRPYLQAAYSVQTRLEEAEKVAAGTVNLLLLGGTKHTLLCCGV